jgi:fatty acid desaturase
MTLAASRPIRRTEPRATASGKAQAAHASDYTALAKQIRAAGLLERRPLWYASRFASLAVLLAGAFAALLLLGPTWWQLLVAVAFGVLFTQVAFLSHDAAHRQIFTNGKVGEHVSRVIGNLVIGLSYGWWMNKHSRHHANPNVIGKDGDIAPGPIAFVPADAAKRTGIKAWLTARQGWYFFPLLLLAGMDLHVNAVKSIFKGEVVKQHRVTEGVLIAIRLIGFPVIVFLTLGPVLGAAFMLVQLCTFGFTMAACFAPNHKGMALIQEHEKVDYLRRQVLTSRNISGGWFIEKGMGGLNFQIEHHLFPNMPSGNLRRARPIVKAYCAELGVAYTETTLLKSWAIVVRYIHRVGIRHADPFDCPAAANFRSA